MTGSELLYATMHAYLTANGWLREEPGSGWWFNPQTHNDILTLGEACEHELLEHGVDTRLPPETAREPSTGDFGA